MASHHKIMRLHHFFLKFVNLSVKIEYNAVGVDYTARQIGLITRPALTGRAFFITRKENPYGC
jgi:hypothetical protein